MHVLKICYTADKEQSLTNAYVLTAKPCATYVYFSMKR